MSIDTFKEVRKLASIALCDVNDVIEYGSMDRLEEESDALVCIQDKLRIILTIATDAIEELK